MHQVAFCGRSARACTSLVLLTVIVPRYIAPSVIVIVINEPDSPPRIRRNFGDDTHFTITTVYNSVARLYALVHCLGRDRCGIEHCGPRAVLAPHRLLGDQSLVLMHDFVLGGIARTTHDALVV